LDDGDVDLAVEILEGSIDEGFCDSFVVGFIDDLVVLGDTDDDDGNIEGFLDSGDLVGEMEGGVVVVGLVVGNRERDADGGAKDFLDGNEVVEMVGNREGDLVVVLILGTLVCEDTVGENDGDVEVETIIGDRVGNIELVNANFAVGLADEETLGLKLGADVGTAADGITVEEIDGDPDGAIVFKSDGEVVGGILGKHYEGNFEGLIVFTALILTLVGALVIISILTLAIAFTVLTGGGMLFEK
jgi:hypothetical protein